MVSTERHLPLLMRPCSSLTMPSAAANKFFGFHGLPPHDVLFSRRKTFFCRSVNNFLLLYRVRTQLMREVDNRCDTVYVHFDFEFKRYDYTQNKR